jgi:ATP-dependent Lon protease
MLTTAIIAGVLQKEIRKEVAISAVVGEDGRALPVGGIEEKLFAAIEKGKTVFLVSKDQKIKYEDEFQKKIKIVRIENAEDAAEIALA